MSTTLNYSPRLTKAETKILNTLAKHDGCAQAGVLVKALGKRYDAFMLQKLLTPLCNRGLVIRHGITVCLTAA